MKVLVACEFSGKVREAFRALGYYDTWSCDLEPAADHSPNHLQGDVFAYASSAFDLMIAHPPCTYLSAAGLHYCRHDRKRRRLRDEAVEFTKRLMALPIKRIAIENPVGYLSTAWRKPDQIVRMNEFGHSEAIKPTCLWLKGLPKIKPTEIVEPRRRAKRESEWYSLTKDKKLRSITFDGFARAMAEQWATAK